MAGVTQLLDAVAAGDRNAAADLLPLVYEDLRKLAAARMAAEVPGHTLDPTALVHEAYLRLIGPHDSERWDGRPHFFAAAAEAMRRILVDAARRKAAVANGGGRRRVELVDVQAPISSEDDIVALDEALTRLAEEDPIAGRVAEVRRFAGAGHEQIAESLGITVYEARRKWAYARAWLRDALGS